VLKKRRRRKRGNKNDRHLCRAKRIPLQEALLKTACKLPALPMLSPLVFELARTESLEAQAATRRPMIAPPVSFERADIELKPVEGKSIMAEPGGVRLKPQARSGTKSGETSPALLKITNFSCTTDSFGS
jgi:hypothetical protein